MTVTFIKYKEHTDVFVSTNVLHTARLRRDAFVCVENGVATAMMTIAATTTMHTTTLSTQQENTYAIYL